MPELPEVETIRRDLQKALRGKLIKRLDIIYPSSLKSDEKIFKKLLVGNFFCDIRRIGKLLLFVIGEGSYFLAVHLKMTGQLVYDFQDGFLAGGHSEQINKEIMNLPNRHTRIIIIFKDGSKLFFNDLRRFGYLQVIKKEELIGVKNKFGIEPLKKEFTLENFIKIMRSSKNSKIKTTLLDQKKIAGIGNIYADEILHHSKIRPDRLVRNLTNQDLKNIFLSTEKIISQAIKYRGTTFNNYLDAKGQKGNFVKHLKVYGRKGAKCYGCGVMIKKIKQNGRGTHYCPKCQRW
jgi:formamidopyrimidine-DNA glycosylase